MRILLALMLTIVASPALAFEGIVDAKSLGAPTDAGVELRIQVSKQGDVRIDTSTKDGSKKSSRATYIKPSKGKYDYAIDHDRKQATKIPKDMIAKMAKRAESHETGKSPNVQVKNLGTETVSGHKTRHVQVVDKDEGTSTDLWLSDRYSAELWKNVFSFGGERGKSASNQWTQVMQKKYGFKPGFVMKMLSKDKSGKKSGLQVTWIEEKKVDAKEFSVPPGYAVVEMPDMSGMAGAMPDKMPTTQEEAEQMQQELMKKLKEMQEKQR